MDWIKRLKVNLNGDVLTTIQSIQTGIVNSEPNDYDGGDCVIINDI